MSYSLLRLGPRPILFRVRGPPCVDDFCSRWICRFWTLPWTFSLNHLTSCGLRFNHCYHGGQRAVGLGGARWLLWALVVNLGFALHVLTSQTCVETLCCILLRIQKLSRRLLGLRTRIAPAMETSGAVPTAFSFAGTHRAIFGRLSPA